MVANRLAVRQVPHKERKLATVERLFAQLVTPNGRSLLRLIQILRLENGRENSVARLNLEEIETLASLTNLTNLRLKRNGVTSQSTPKSLRE
jgi:hypothetical protein